MASGNDNFYGELNALSNQVDKLFTYSYLDTGGCEFTKIGYICVLRVRNMDLRNKSVAAWGSTILTTITNTHALPKRAVQSPTFLYDGGNTPAAVSIVYDTDGTITFLAKNGSFSGGSNTWGGYFTLTYIANDCEPLNSSGTILT